MLLTGCSVLIRDSALSSRYVTCIPHYRSALGTQVTLSTIHNTLSVDYLWFVSFKSHKTGLVVICSFMLRSLSYCLKLPPTLDNRKCRTLNERSLLFRLALAKGWFSRKCCCWCFSSFGQMQKIKYVTLLNIKTVVNY